MAENAVALLDALRREGVLRVLEIFGVLAGRHGAHEGADAVWVGCIALQPLREGRQQRLYRKLRLLLRQVELPRQHLHALSILGVRQHVVEWKHFLLLKSSAGAEPNAFPRRVEEYEAECRKRHGPRGENGRVYA